MLQGASLWLSKKEKTTKPTLMYMFFTRLAHKYNFPQNCKTNENKSSKFEVAPTALLLLVNFGTCKHMHMHKRRNSAGSMSNLCSLQKVKSNIIMGAAHESSQKIKSNINTGTAHDNSLHGAGSARGRCLIYIPNTSVGFYCTSALIKMAN